MLKKAVLFLVFNRPDTTKRVFEAIREARPPRLYVAADGPREDKVGEKEKCNEVRKIVEKVDWECEVKTLFRDKNLGCGIGVSDSIDWFFENEEDGIILEDDCLPHQTFFSYCETLLDYYKDNEQIMSIGGTRIFDFEYGNASYFFTSMPHCWGWASFRRAWKYNDYTLKKYPQHVMEEKLFYIYGPQEMRHAMLNKYIERRNDKAFASWDHRWYFSVVANDGLSISPNVNLISNIGFGADATSTKEGISNSIYPLIDIKHPEKVERNMFIDERSMGGFVGNPFFIIGQDSKLSQLSLRFDKLINTLVWWIPVRKWRDDFRAKFYS